MRERHAQNVQQQHMLANSYATKIREEEIERASKAPKREES